MPKDISKILLLGLDNSGKTSIVLSLQKNINLLDYTSLEPTKKFDIIKLETSNSRFHIWDFGGQEQYRDDHLKNLNSYLTSVKKIIYVIDIQDNKRYNLALTYFDEILSIIKNQEIYIKLSIFFHKFDPDVKIEESIISDLLKKISEKVPSYINYKIYKTSIFTIFRKISLI